MSADRDARIKDLAFRLWDQHGRPDGRDLEFWLKAEAQIDAPVKVAPKAKAAPKSKAAAPMPAVKPAARVKAAPKVAVGAAAK